MGFRLTPMRRVGLPASAGLSCFIVLIYFITQNTSTSDGITLK